MFHKPVLVAALAFCLNACVTSPNSEPNPNTLDEVRTSLSRLEDSLATRFDEVCQQKELALETKLQKAKKSARRARSRLAAAEKQCESRAPSEKMILGEIEFHELLNESLKLEARIDTGAETSSIGVYNLTKFERDGDDWVKFKLDKAKDAPVYEYAVHDDVRIKLRNGQGTEARFEIKMDIKLGKKEYRKQIFNLADRRHLDYQILIGRNFLRDIAIVDVGAKHQLKRQ